jgi:hypothetical protein
MVKRTTKVVTSTSGETMISAFWVVASVFLLSFFGMVIFDALSAFLDFVLRP